MTIQRARHDSATHPLQTPNETYRFVAPQRGRVVLRLCLGASLAAVAALLFQYASTRDTSMVLGAGVATVVAVVVYAMLLARIPQIVTMRNSILEIKHNGHTERFDLADPTVEIFGKDGQMSLRCYDGREAVVRARDVQWSEFTDVVMHYQSYADQLALDRARRFSR